MCGPDRAGKWISFAAVLAVMMELNFAYAQQTPTHPAPEPVFRQQSPRIAPGVSAGAVSGPAAGRAAEETIARPAANAVYSIRAEDAPARAKAPGMYQPTLDAPVAYAEPPKGGERMFWDTKDGPMPAPEFLSLISESTKWNIVSSPGVATRSLSFWLDGATPQQALEVLKFHGIHYEFDADTGFLYVMTREEYLDKNLGAVNEAEFTVKHAGVADIETALQSLMSPKGRMITDPRSGRILVWDTQANLDEMAGVVKRLDVPLEARTFQLRHADAEALLDTVAAMLTERGLAQVDPRSNTLIVTDLPARQAQIGEIIAAIDQKLTVRTWTLDYADEKTVAERIDALIPEGMGAVTANEDTHQVTVTAVDERLAEIDELIAQWDVKGQQVQIEAFLVSAATTVARELGISWSYFEDVDGDPLAIRTPGATPDYRSLGERTATVGTLPSPIPRYNWLTGRPYEDIAGNAIVDRWRFGGLSAVLEYLERTEEVSILSRPRVTVWDGEPAVFKNIEERPYQTGGYSTTYYTGDADDIRYRVIPLRVEFVNVGTILEVEPRINQEGNILMTVTADDSTADNVVVTIADQTSTVPQRRMSRVETRVLVQDGQTLVIGGLRAGSVEDDVDKVPLLGDLPLLGRLFKTTQKDHRDRELLVFITPTIVNERTRSEAERLAELEQNLATTMRHSRKTIWGRIDDRISRGDNEMVVAIGENGHVTFQGEKKSMETLEKALAAVENPDRVTVVVRAHPGAPKRLAVEIGDLVIESGLALEYDTAGAPIVPSY